MKKILILFLVLLIGAYLGFNFAVSQRVAFIKSSLEDSLVRLIKNPARNQIAKECNIPSYKFSEEQNPASLIVGHAYGSSINTSGTIAPNLSKFLLKNSSSFEKIIFTGDVIMTPSVKKWKDLKNQLKQMGLKIKIAPGNHDVGTTSDNAYRDIFFQEFKLTYPYYEKKDESVYIYIDSTMNPGKIDKETLLFLENSKLLDKTLFIFSHHLLRPQPHLIANTLTGHRLDINNIDVLRGLQNKFKKIYLISGDAGINFQGIDCLKFQNLYFISSGINNSDEDRALILKDGNLYQIKLVN